MLKIIPIIIIKLRTYFMLFMPSQIRKKLENNYRKFGNKGDRMSLS